jgi:hypothetical protein
MPDELVLHSDREAVGELGIRRQRLGQDGSDVAPASVLGNDVPHEAARTREPPYPFVHIFFTPGAPSP